MTKGPTHARWNVKSETYIQKEILIILIFIESINIKLNISYPYQTPRVKTNPQQFDASFTLQHTLFI